MLSQHLRLSSSHRRQHEKASSQLWDRRRKRRETPLRRWAAASEKPRLLPASFWQAEEEEEKGPGLNGDIGQTLRSCWSVRRVQRGTHVHIHGFRLQDYVISKIPTMHTVSSCNHLLALLGRNHAGLVCTNCVM